MGPHGPYAIATTQVFTGSVTFSLERNVWQEHGHPEPGEVVFLYELREKRQGWRAKKGRHWKPSDEQTAQEEEIMERLMFLLKRLRSKWFPTEEDMKWKKWVDFKSREVRDLLDLLSQQVNDSFKKRALFLLMVPSAAVNPLYWKGDIGKFYHRSDILDKLTPDLLSYVSELITQFVTALSPMHCDRPRNVAEGGGGIMVYMSIPDKYHDALHFYNHCILKLLAKLPAEQAEKIFPLYSLNDISTFWNMDFASGYNPFRNLMYSDDINEKWKRLADGKMRDIVRAEIEGKAKPREEHEDALRCYSSFIQMQFYGLHYSKKFFIEQVQFLVDNLQSNKHLIDAFNVINFFELLSADSFKELRHKIARYAVIKNVEEYGRFHVYDAETRRAAGQMLEEFADDQELVEKVRELIAEREKRDAEDAVHQAEKKETEESILEAMK
ncbi:MAG: Uncharacterized protein Athens071425_138 [Parcubacteria group bacterium Athens0714_25]|nr:MAG: Uncharacterized protein Athens071425_138 [Parcubacteria group bacterium Athens0714_25]